MSDNILDTISNIANSVSINVPREFDIGFVISVVYCLILIVYFFDGTRNGFVSQILLTGRLFISVIVTKIFGPILCVILEKQSALFSFTNVFHDYFEKININDVLPSSFSDKMKSFGMLEKTSGLFENNPLNSFINGQIVSGIRDNFVRLASTASLKVVSYAIVFILSMMIIQLAAKTFPIINYIPIIGTINNILGGVVSALYVLLITQLILWAISSISSIPIVKLLISYVEKSNVLNYLLTHNLFNYILH